MKDFSSWLLTENTAGETARAKERASFRTVSVWTRFERTDEPAGQHYETRREQTGDVGGPFPIAFDSRTQRVKRFSKPVEAYFVGYPDDIQLQVILFVCSILAPVISKLSSVTLEPQESGHQKVSSPEADDLQLIIAELRLSILMIESIPLLTLFNGNC